MATRTLSTRLTQEETKELDNLVEETGVDRSSLVKSLLRRGMRELRLELAVETYAAGRVSLSRAAELGGVSVWDFIALMGEKRLELHYGEMDLDEDFNAFASDR